GSPLFVASRRGHKQIVQLLLERGADVNLVLDRTSQYRTALEAATAGREEDIVQLLLDKGATPIRT
ncbi:hypothetical protein P153DRAFT_285514, partial [Dothidotthia symphoricarpi CBS 119687]